MRDRRRHRGVQLVVGVALLLAGCSSHEAAPKKTSAPPPVTVMTRNLYLGGDLRLLTRGTSLAQVNADIIAVLEQVTGSNPPRRMAWVADEIIAAKADVVALQEVATWRLLGMPSVKGLEQPASYDFLSLLQGSLAAKGAHYRVAAAQTNFDTTVQLSGIPLPLTYADRDVILVREGADAPQVASSGQGTFATQLRQRVTAIGRTLDFRRGYVWADLTSAGRRWRMVDTHAEAFPGLTAATYRDYGGEQAAELVTALSSVATPLVVAGDLNSAAGEQKRKTYSVLVERGRFRDAWAQAGNGATGLSCCRNATLSAGALSERIDHVLVRGPVTVQKAGEVGVQPDATTVPRWPSDHAGVTATLTVG